MKNRRIVEIEMEDGTRTFKIEYKVLGLFWMGEFPYTRTFSSFKKANATAKHEQKRTQHYHEIE